MPNRKVTRFVTPTETLDIEDTRVDNVVNGTTNITYDNSVSGLTATTVKGAIDELDDLLLDVPFDANQYRIACDQNGFSANDNNRFLQIKGRKVTLFGVTYFGNVYNFINNFNQFEDFVITRNGTFDWVLNQANVTVGVGNTPIFQPAGTQNFETSQAGNHRVWLITTDGDPTAANTTRILVFEKL